MGKHVYLGFRNGKLETVILSNSKFEDVLECDYWIDNPQEAKKQVEKWLTRLNI